VTKKYKKYGKNIQQLCPCKQINQTEGYISPLFVHNTRGQMLVKN